MDAIQIGIDRDIVEWFSNDALKFRANINAALRQYIKAQKQPRKAQHVPQSLDRSRDESPPKRAAVKS